jgi:DNA-binding NtrC family response regulator
MILLLSFKDIILEALKKSNFVQTKAADLLGISRRILKYKMDKYGMAASPEDDMTPAENPEE